MPTLNEIVGGNTSGTRTLFTTNFIAIEPLNGPTSVEEVMDRFPEETYQQGRDTHLFRFLSALCGDAGAGLAKKQAYASRLRYEAEFVQFDILNDVYVAQFQFQRLASETYPFNADVDALTPTQWNDVELANQRYYHRMARWWEAVRYGNSPEGIRLAAEAGTGLPCDVSEQYRFIYDQFSDMPLDLKPDGITGSCEEVVILPRLVPGQDVSYSTGYEKQWEFTPPTLTDTGRPVPSPGITAPSLVWVPPPQAKVEMVGHAEGDGSTITLPAHFVGDLIVVTSTALRAAPVAPAGGGTVPSWVTHRTELSTTANTRLTMVTASAVATASNHTSGTWANSEKISVAVFRPTNGTISAGECTGYRHLSGGEPQSPFIRYPALSLANKNGTSTVYRAAGQKETGDSILDNPGPVGYSLISTLGAAWGMPSAHATFSRAAALESPADELVRSSHTGGPGTYLTHTLEVKITPGPGVFVESEADRTARWALEATQYIAKEPFDRLLPEIERNAVEMLDRLKPATSVMTFVPQEVRREAIPVTAPPAASSERINVTRFVTGSTAVPWPETNAERNLFLVGGQETEPGHYYGMERDLPIIFLTTESVRAYKAEALGDATYGSNDFFTEVAGVAPYGFYRSEHEGPFFPVLGAIYPFIFNVLPSATFGADQAVAVQNTPLVMEGRFVG